MDNIPHQNRVDEHCGVGSGTLLVVVESVQNRKAPNSQVAGEKLILPDGRLSILDGLQSTLRIREGSVPRATRSFA